MAIKANDQHALDELVAEHKGSWGGCDEDYFALIYLRKRFKANVEDVKHQVAFGGKDYGIDAYYIDHAAHNLYLYQFKWTENHQQFKISLDRLTKDGIDRIFGNPLQDTEQNPVLTYLKKEMNEARDHIGNCSPR